MRINVKQNNIPNHGVLVYCDAVLQFYVIEADDEEGWLEHYDSEWDDDKQKWNIKHGADGFPVVLKKTGTILIETFPDRPSLEATYDSYLKGLDDARNNKSNWGAGLHPYNYKLRDDYDRGFAAGTKGH
jgi:hypothetical protein